jgi:hypothetical protein
MTTFSGFGHAYFAVLCALVGARLGSSIAEDESEGREPAERPSDSFAQHD